MDKNRATVRYMIDDVAAAIAFYTTHLGFEIESEALPAFAAITRGPLRLLLSGPASSGRRARPDGRQTAPGGWNRIQIHVADLAKEVARRKVWMANCQLAGSIFLRLLAHKMITKVREQGPKPDIIAYQML